MIIVDTNVLSALMRERTDRAVIAWLDAQPAESLWTTAVTVFEIRFGIGTLPAGRRRKMLEAAFEGMVSGDLGGRVLPFDDGAAAAAAAIAARLRPAGRPVDMRDIQIAGIAAVRRGTLATRNRRHFADAGIELVDPWGGA